MDVGPRPSWLVRHVDGMVLTLSALALCSITAGVVLLWGYPVALLVAGSLVWGECLLASWASLAVEARKGKA